MQRARKDDMKQLHMLTSRSDFVAMNKSAAKWVSHGMVVQVMPNDTQTIRVGYTVTKKTEKSAVKRNRIKRRLRAAAADILPFFAQTGHDYVLIGRHQTALRPYTDLTNDLKWCLKKLDKTAS